MEKQRIPDTSRHERHDKLIRDTLTSRLKAREPSPGSQLVDTRIMQSDIQRHKSHERLCNKYRSVNKSVDSGLRCSHKVGGGGGGGVMAWWWYSERERVGVFGCWRWRWSVDRARERERERERVRDRESAGLCPQLSAHRRRPTQCRKPRCCPRSRRRRRECWPFG